MTYKSEVAEIEFQYATGVINYEEYRRAVKEMWARREPPPRKQRECELEFNPEPGIAVRTTLARGRMSR